MDSPLQLSIPRSLPASRFSVVSPALVGKYMPERVSLKSRQWSCSEMVRGHGELLAVKSEKDGDDELAQKIKDGLCPDTF